MSQESTTVEATPVPPQSPRQVALGLFILFQLAFLITSNAVGFIHSAGSEHFKDEPKKLINRLAPKFADDEGQLWSWTERVEAGTRCWMQLTGQDQDWSLFSSAYKATGFPVVLLLWDDAPAFGPSIPGSKLEYDTKDGFHLTTPFDPPAVKPNAVWLPSENAPLDPSDFVRFGKSRVRRYEGEYYLDPLPYKDEPRVDAEERMTRRMKKLVADSHDPALRYMQWRFKTWWQRAHTVDPPPKQVILFEQFYRIRGPDEPRGWDGPFLVPQARWRPVRRERQWERIRRAIRLFRSAFSPPGPMNAMNVAPASESQIVGIQPWLPWPLSAWSWWNTPVRAERLAILRIGVGLVLLVDVLCNYAPDTLDYFGHDGLGDPGVFDWRFNWNHNPPRMVWSLLRGVGDSTTQAIGLLMWIIATLWILGNSLARFLLMHKNPPPKDRSGISFWIWSFSFGWYVASLWSQMIYADPQQLDALAWIVPLAGVSLACLFLAIDLAARLRDASHRIPWFAVIFSFVFANALSCAGMILALVKEIDKTAWWVRLLGSWQNDDALLLAAMIAWIAAPAFLVVGCATRPAAVVAWLLSLSFQNANPNLDNAGDTIRIILLFYLMLCPCGAVWSADSLMQRRRGAGPVYVHPWPICLIFVQMILMYWMNGLYKLFGETWCDGSSLHYVLGDLALARFSQIAWPLPIHVTRIMTWTVLAWETLLPLLVIFKWPRRVALCIGVIFHLGIFASLELGPFALYALCMYLPMIPWEWLGRSSAGVGQRV